MRLVIFGLTVSSSPPRRAHLAAAARALQFTPQRMAEAVLSSYRPLLAGRSTAPREELTCA